MDVRIDTPILSGSCYTICRGAEKVGMSDRGFLFLFSVFMIVASLATAVWLGISGQALTVDGLFLVLVALLTALVFLLYVVFMIRRAMDPPAKPAPAKAPSKAPAPAAAKEQAI
jgi:hypothetical protein